MTKEQLIELVKFTAGEIVAPTTLNNEDAESIVDDFVDAKKLTIPVDDSAFYLGQQVRHKLDNCPFTVTGIDGNRIRLKGNWSGGVQPIDAECWVNISGVSKW